MAKAYPKWVTKVIEKEKTERGIPLEVKEIQTGCYYLYHSTTKWSKEEKKAKKVSQYLGKITPAGIIAKGNVRKHVSVYEYGAVKLIHDLIEESLNEPLSKYFYRYMPELKAIFLMKLLKDLPVKQMKDFWEKTYLSLELNASLSPATITSIYENIGRDLKSQYEYFSHFATNDDYYAFDLSSLFSYSNNINLAEKGHNHNEIHQEQINFFMLYSITRGVPVMLKPMPGSIRDIKSLSHELKHFKMSNITLVTDRGFASYVLMAGLKKQQFKYVVPLRRNFKLIDYGLPLEEVFTYRKRGIRWASKSTPYGKLYLFEDVKLRSEEESTFINSIEEGRKKKKDYELEKKKFGKIAIISNVKSKGPKIYTMYKEREGVEVAFDSMKNQLEMDKTYLQSTEAVRGYFFVIFNVLFLYYKILNILKINELNKKTSVSDVLMLLSKVYLVDFGHKKHVTEIPKKVEDLVKNMQLKHENIFPKFLQS